MTSNNLLTLAVAGSGKTQSIVDACVAADPAERILVLTYTAANQQELRERLATSAGDRHNVEVRGWFSFLLNDIARPYLPFLYKGERVRGFDFKSPPQQRVANENWTRYFNKHGEARRVHLPQLAHRVNNAASGKPVARLERVYDRIFIDEVQDLCGWDLEVLRLLMASSIPLELVGDVRQAIISTNDQEPKNKKYQKMKIWDWFRGEENLGRLTIGQMSKSHRCRPEITALGDSLFSSELGFDATESLNTRGTAHDGIFLVRSRDVRAYVQAFSPMFLRWSANSGKAFDDLAPLNIGKSKGLGADHVLVFPTGEMEKHLQNRTQLERQRAAYLYVAITRAKQSVAFILDEPGLCQHTPWSPSG